MAYHNAQVGKGVGAIVAEGANQTPIVLQMIDSLSFEYTKETEPVNDANGNRVDSFVKSQTLNGKIETKELESQLIKAVMLGATLAPGSKVGGIHQAPIPATPFQITVPQGATFAENLGVVDLTAGKKMAVGATSNGAGIYSINVATGVYTFNTADVGHQVQIFYRYTATDGVTVTASALTSSTTEPVLAIYFNSLTGSKWSIHVPRAKFPNLSVGMSKDTWGTVSLSWEAEVDSLNQLCKFSVKE
jgi:hypothetical protein